MSDLAEKWERGECTYPRCPIRNMMQLNCKDCPVIKKETRL